MLSRRKEAAVPEAPRWRQFVAVAIDASASMGIVWLLRGSADRSLARRLLGTLGPSSELFREQLRSPGQRLLGLRTVHRGSGRRVEPWRTATMLALGVASSETARRLGRERPEEQTRREDTELNWLTPRVAAQIALPLLAGLLRRRLAPTVEVLADRSSED